VSEIFQFVGFLLSAKAQIHFNQIEWQILRAKKNNFLLMLRLTGDDADAATEAKMHASEAFSEGNFEKAVLEYTNAVRLGAASALVFSKRGEALLHLKKPLSALR
jgi:hypothetical protein